MPTKYFASPAEALNAVAVATEPTDRIVVFGSFLTVGGVLQHGVPHLEPGQPVPPPKPRP